MKRFLQKGDEQAHEDGAVSFFRSIYGAEFKKGHSEAEGADGYVPGVLVAELKGAQTDWYSGFFQAIAYLKDLDAVAILVACKDFIALWNLSSLPEELRQAVKSARGAPSSIGPKLAQQHRSQKEKVLKLASWQLASSTLTDGKETEFRSEIDILVSKIGELSRRKARETITPRNFLWHLEQMKDFFSKPLDAVTAFYDLVDLWTQDSSFKPHPKRDDCGVIGNGKFSAEVKGLRPNKRTRFAEFVESKSVTEDEEEIREFFAIYDQALDAVAPDYRRQNGIFFTDINLARFAMWFTREDLGKQFGEKYLILDPACGSGNLVSSWRSPLLMRHKVVSDIDPIHLSIVKKRLSLDPDPFQRGHFTVVPDPSTGGFLNFIDKSAEEYLRELKGWLKKAGESTNRPLGILCNPPYRNDDDNISADKAAYAPDPSLIEICGKDAGSDRLSMFLAQMKRICEVAEGMKMPKDAILLLFTNSTWLTKRPLFQKLRDSMLKTFEPVNAFLVNSKEFFDTPNQWPLAFSIWAYNPDPGRDTSVPVNLLDLTHLRRSALVELPWDKTGTQKADSKELDVACKKIVSTGRPIQLGADRLSIRLWSGGTRKDFQRELRKGEKAEKKKGASIFGGFPRGSELHGRKKTCGESDGSFIGLMDNLTPCRISQDPGAAPWSRLDPAFANIRRARLLSSRPDKYGYDHSLAPRKTLTWYALAKTFATEGLNYPLWANQEELWSPWPSTEDGPELFIKLVFALALADNECIETEFPAGNPIAGAPRALLENPLSFARGTFWSATLSTDSCWAKGRKDDEAAECVAAVRKVYRSWSGQFGSREHIQAEFIRPYFIVGDPVLSKNCGLLQIRHYAAEHSTAQIIGALSELDQATLKVKQAIFDWLTDKKKLDYFGKGAEQSALEAKKLLAQRELEEAKKSASEKESKKRKKKRA